MKIEALAITALVVLGLLVGGGAAVDTTDESTAEAYMTSPPDLTSPVPQLTSPNPQLTSPVSQADSPAPETSPIDQIESQSSDGVAPQTVETHLHDHTRAY
ncbi:hypothetical protein [Halorussus salinisoli]|uniref:hypothetical protein n=1 Tax=Halorussus salinisoli TaxID=2558242 RepID=UPI0010C213A6|nr:hypothetical protein [Halorussus salinisoli]